MKYLLDASALVPLLSDFGEQLIVKATEIQFLTMDLAVYEAGNSLWKLSTLLKSISLEDAVEVMGVLKDIVERGIVQGTRFGELDLTRALKMASEEGMTFYDSSYVLAAEDKGATLVTEDRKLREAASKYVDTMTYMDFRHEIMLGKRQ